MRIRIDYLIIIVVTWILAAPLGSLAAGPRVTPRTSASTNTLAIELRINDISAWFGTWQLTAYPAGFTNETSGSGTLDAIEAPTGTYAVTFGISSEFESGFRLPAPQTNQLTEGGSLVFTGIYELVIATLAPGDFDGDRLADPAIYDDNNGWYLWLSGNNYQILGPIAFVAVGSYGVTADFDGDGLSDPAIYSEAEGWRAWLSSSGYAPVGPVSFQKSDYLPVPGDFDGDRLGDLGLYNGDVGWYFKLSTENYEGESGPYPYKQSGFKPVLADFDGDRKADPAVYLNITGWYVWYSSLDYERIEWPNFVGVATGPFGADFDGDAKADPGIDSGGYWYTWLSGSDYQSSGPWPFHAPE